MSEPLIVLLVAGVLAITFIALGYYLMFRRKNRISHKKKKSDRLIGDDK